MTNVDTGRAFAALLANRPPTWPAVAAGDDPPDLYPLRGIEESLLLLRVMPAAKRAKRWLLCWNVLI